MDSSGGEKKTAKIRKAENELGVTSYRELLSYHRTLHWVVVATLKVVCQRSQLLQGSRTVH